MWTFEFSAVLAVESVPLTWVAVGTGLGADTVVPWLRIRRHRSWWTYDGSEAGLLDGGVYWSMVQTESGVRSGARTVLDTSPPVVADRRLAVEAPHPSSTFLMDRTATVCWRGMFTDAHSGIDAYDVTLHQPSGTVASYRRLAAPCVNVSHNLPSGATITVDVTAFNAVGLSATLGTALTVDLSPPVPPAEFFYATPSGDGGSDSMLPVVAQVLLSTASLPSACHTRHKWCPIAPAISIIPRFGQLYSKIHCSAGPGTLFPGTRCRFRFRLVGGRSARDGGTTWSIPSYPTARRADGWR